MALWTVPTLITILVLSGTCGSTRVRARVSSHDVQKRHTPLCNRRTVFSIEGQAVGAEHLGWMETSDWIPIMKGIDPMAHPFVRVTIDGLPCVQQSCCQYTVLIRPNGSDIQVLAYTIPHYSAILQKLPWAPTAILEGGGNIGIATLVMAHLYPDATIVVLEPHPENCFMAKANTMSLKNVHVRCEGLWRTETNIALTKAGDGREWAWQLKETNDVTQDTIKVRTADGLLAEYGLSAFDYAKLDIEGAEYEVFGDKADIMWLAGVQLMTLEIHPDKAATPADIAKISEITEAAGFSHVKITEFDVYAKENLRSYFTT